MEEKRETMFRAEVTASWVSLGDWPMAYLLGMLLEACQDNPLKYKLCYSLNTFPLPPFHVGKQALSDLSSRKV